MYLLYVLYVMCVVMLLCMHVSIYVLRLFYV